MLYKAGKDLIHWNFVLREKFQNYLYDLLRIRELGYIVLGVTSDWHGSIVSAVDFVFRGNIPHQRCLVHSQRLCETLLTKNPQTEAGIKLLEIVKHLNQIRSPYEASLWKNRLRFWERDYGYLTKERTSGEKEDGTKTWWYTHKNLRRSFKSLKTTLDYLFLYLDYEGLEKDVNGLESEFSHLKQKISMHRGLKRERKIKTIYWFCHLVSLRRKTDQKTNTF